MRTEPEKAETHTTAKDEQQEGLMKILVTFRQLLGEKTHETQLG